MDPDAWYCCFDSGQGHLSVCGGRGRAFICCFYLVICGGTASLALWLRRLPREWKIPGSNPACAGILQGSSHTSDLKIGTPVATLP